MQLNKVGNLKMNLDLEQTFQTIEQLCYGKDRAEGTIYSAKDLYDLCEGRDYIESYITLERGSCKYTLTVRSRRGALNMYATASEVFVLAELS